MSTPVAFDFAVWSQQFPKLAQIADDTVAGLYFRLATSVCDNTDTSPIPNDAPENTRETVLYLLVSHLVALFVGDGSLNPDGSAAGPTGLVGRIESATEGAVTVNVGKYAEGLPPSAAFYVQTQYGALAWQLLAPFRMARYVPAPRSAYASPIAPPGWGGRTWLR